MKEFDELMNFLREMLKDESTFVNESLRIILDPLDTNTIGTLDYYKSVFIHVVRHSRLFNKKLDIWVWIEGMSKLITQFVRQENSSF